MVCFRTVIIPNASAVVFAIYSTIRVFINDNEGRNNETHGDMPLISLFFTPDKKMKKLSFFIVFLLTAYLPLV